MAAKDGVSPEELVRAIQPILPADAEVATGEAEVATQAEGTNEDIAVVQKFLLAFAGLALFVGGFVIFNTLSTTVAQRTRELATLRTLGASRRQVLGSVVLESLVIGALGSAIGLLLGPALAKGLSALFVASARTCPRSALVVATRTIVVSLLAGILITLVAGLIPGAPGDERAADRGGARGRRSPSRRSRRTRPTSRARRSRSASACSLFGMFAGRALRDAVLLLLALGCLVLFLGVALISSRLVTPLASILAWPAAQVAGAAGRLARENSVRNPAPDGRDRLRADDRARARHLRRGARPGVAELDSATRSSGWCAPTTSSPPTTASAPLSPQARRALATQPGVETVSGVRQGSASVFGSDELVAGVDPATIAQVVSFDWDERSDASLAALGASGAVLQRGFADEHDLGVGSGSASRRRRGRGSSSRFGGSTPRRSSTRSSARSSSRSRRSTPRSSGLRTRSCSSPRAASCPIRSGRPRAGAQRFPEAELQTKAEFAEGRQKEIKDLLTCSTSCSSLSMVVSLFGMVNTVVLSVFERTRELGMLRAIGMTRRQVRRMIRHESVITALIGAALGLPLGIFLAALATQALADEGVAFSLPGTTLVVFALIAVGAGILAAALPARRASRLNVLEALQYE